MNIQKAIKKLTSAGAPFEVVINSSLDGSPAIYKNAPSTLTAIIENARHHGEVEFLISGERRITFKEFFEQVDQLRTAWHEKGLKKGDRVAIASINNPDWLIAFTAAILMGAIAVPINSWGKEAELRFALSDCGASWLVCDVKRGHAVDGLFTEDHRFIIAEPGEEVSCRGTPLNDVFEGVFEGADVPPLEAANPEDTCLILYTSGSTGAPKGVAHCHGGIAQAIFNMMFTGMLSMEVEGPVELVGGAKRDKALVTIPLFHGSALLGLFVISLVTAQALVFMRKWNAQEALKLIDFERITLFNSVPALVKDLLSQPNIDDFDIRCLQRVASGGAATPSDVPKLIKETLYRPILSSGYGMTETLAVGSSASGTIYEARPGASGVRSPIMSVRCAAPSGEVLPDGEIGEIQMRGVTVTKGYWNKPEANRSVFTADGWFKSGDLGFVDSDGYLHVTGRIKDIVIRGGENIFPGEIEQAIYRLDVVADCVVFGVPDEHFGEELAAVISTKEGQQLTSDMVRDALAPLIAGYKVPKHIVTTTIPLPRGATEKLDKLAIREDFLTNHLRNEI